MKHNSLDKSWNIPIRLLTFIAILGCAGLATAVAAATVGETWETEAPSSSTVDLVVDVQDVLGRGPLDLEARDFEVRESGESRNVLDVRPLAGGEEWRIVIYLDPAFLHPAYLPATLKSLADRADELTALGTVEVVRAVSRPHHRLESSREADAVRTAIYSLPFPYSGRGSIAEVRQTFLAGADETDPDALRDLVRQSARRELALAGERLQVLRHWISTQPVSDTPTAFLWITDGFDVTMTEFYDRASKGRLHDEVVQTLEPYGLSDKVEDLVGELLAAGWTALPVVRGATRAVSPGHQLWVDGLKPLRLAAVHTGGLVLSPARMAEVSGNLGRRWVVTYEIEPEVASEAPQKVDVTVRRQGLVAYGALWRGRPTEFDVGSR